ncbi:MAG: 1-acyl-sn-glycerol-3-phosphate acyltransferase [Bacteroidota bacterium]
MSFVVATFFKRTKIKNAHYIRVKGPVILAMTHPNAFMDPIAFTTLVYPPRVYYLARGDAFKKGIVTILLESLGIIPIFRIQDGGKEGLKKNDETYERVNALLKRRQKIIIFAEGLCIQERRLRPLKKGVPRMVFGAMEEYNLSDLTVVPVGVNYSNPSQFRGSLFYNIGAPLKVADYMKSYAEAPAKTMNQFLADLTPRLKELIVHINRKESETVIANMEEIYRYDFFKAENLDTSNLEHDFIFSTKVTELVNNAEETHPEKVRVIEEKSSQYLNELKKLGIKDWLLIPEKQKSIHYGNVLLRLMCIVLSFPLYVRGLLGNYIPYKLTDMITTKKVRVIEFKASFNIGIGAIMVLIYYNLQFFIAKALAPNFWWAIAVVVCSFLTGLLCLYLSPFRKKTKGIYRTVQLKASTPEVFENLSKQRKEIITLFKEL